MLKKLNIIHIVLLVLLVCVIPLVGFLQGFSSPNTFIAVVCTVLLGHPLLYLLFMIIKEWVLKDSNVPRFAPLCMVITLLLGCLIWYCFFHIEHIFSQTIELWYSLAILAFAVPIIVTKILEKVLKDKGNGPKIVRNK